MKDEILAINLLRFLAALAVLCVHKFAALVDQGYLPQSFGIFNSFSMYGYLGVNLFFLISGFVITLSSEGRTVGQFISARFIRLFPVFWICVSLSTLFILFLSSNETVSLSKYLSNLIMMPHIYGNHTLIDISYWTLEVEMTFYMTIAVILVLQQFIKISLQTIALWLSVPLFYYVLCYSPYTHFFIDIFLFHFFTLFGSDYAPYFIAGILFYGIYKNTKTIYHYVAILLCYMAAVLEGLDQAYTFQNPASIVLCISLFFFVFLLISLRKITNESFSFLGTNYRKNLMYLGAMTYPLYLLHDTIIGAVVDSLAQKDIPVFIKSILLFFILGSLVYLVNYVDIHIRTLWKNSSITKNALTKITTPWVKKVLLRIF